tara:strand:+ start:381 stop:800 length:420 start_codon:yes stop_codon:yes gene_type:complete
MIADDPDDAEYQLAAVGLLGEETLNPHDLLIRDDLDNAGRTCVLSALKKLGPGALAQHVHALLEMLKHNNEFVSDFPMQALCKLDKLDKPDVWKFGRSAQMRPRPCAQERDAGHGNAPVHSKSLRSWFGRPEIRIGILQ